MGWEVLIQGHCSGSLTSFSFSLLLSRHMKPVLWEPEHRVPWSTRLETSTRNKFVLVMPKVCLCGHHLLHIRSMSSMCEQSRTHVALLGKWAPVMNTAFATDNGWAKICRWTLIHVCTMCTEKEDLLTVYFWVWREGLRQQLHLLHCMQLNGRNLWKQIFWTSGHPCCKESWQNGMKSRHSQETVIKFALEGRKVAPANTCRCVYGCRGTVWESHIPPYWEWASTVSGLLYISLCTFQILWNPTWLVQKHKETYLYILAAW